MFKVAGFWNHQNHIKIEWNLGKRCNYSCSYCPSFIHDNTSPHTDIELLKATVDKLSTINKPLRISFTGGEPTVHPKFEELVDYCVSKNTDFISVTTNATRKHSYYKQLKAKQLVFSLHYEFEWERCLETIIQTIASEDIKGDYPKQFVVHIMAHHNYMDQVKQTVKRLNFYHIPYAIRRVRWSENEDHDIFDDLRYDQKDLDWILENTSTVLPNVVIDNIKSYHANDVIKLHLNKYKGWTCNAGIESLMINWDGEVHRATCRVGGSLGNIYTGSFTMPTEPVICDRNFCTCAADIPLTKELL